VILGWFCGTMLLAEPPPTVEKPPAKPDIKALKALLERKPEIAEVRKTLEGFEQPADPKRPGIVVFYWKIAFPRGYEDHRVRCVVSKGVVIDFKIFDGDGATR
jgi:hypothetical protein